MHLKKIGWFNIWGIFASLSCLQFHRMLSRSFKHRGKNHSFRSKLSAMAYLLFFLKKLPEFHKKWYKGRNKVSPKCAPCDFNSFEDINDLSKSFFRVSFLGLIKLPKTSQPPHAGQHPHFWTFSLSSHCTVGYESPNLTGLQACFCCHSLPHSFEGQCAQYY